MAGVPPPAVETYTIHEFSEKYLETLEDHDGSADSTAKQKGLAAAFAVTGYHDQDGHYANINCLETPLTHDMAEHAVQVRDYDSLLGFVEAICFKSQLWIYLVPNPDHTLKTNLSVKVPFRIGDNTEDTLMSPHLVPNMNLGYLPEGHCIIRIFFPGLYSEKCDVQLDVPHLTAVYTALRSAICEVDSPSSYRWPPSYKSAVDRALKGNSRKHLQWTANAIADQNANPFLRAFERYLCEAHEWGLHMVYQVQVRGVKDLYQHNGTRHEADTQLAKLLTPFYTDVGKWWIDVGMEVVLEGMVLQWRTTAHATVLAHVLKIPDENANRACNLSNHSYHRDMSSHLPDLSGYRVALKRNQGGAVGSVYAQAYQSDKNLTAHKSHHGVAKAVTGHQVVQGFPASAIIQLYDLYRDASKSLACSARLEHRVPLELEGRVFMEPLPTWILNASLLVFEVEDWWGWRSVRIHAIGSLLAIQNKYPARVRFALMALTTTVALAWLANGIHCRPRDNAAGRDVMLASMPLTFNHNDPHILFVLPNREGREDLAVPHCPYNALYLRRLAWPPVSDLVRFQWASVSMNDASFIMYFGLTFTDYFRKKVNSGIAARGGEITRANLPTQKRHTKSHLIEDPDPIPSFLALPAFTLPVPGHEEGGTDIPRNPDAQLAAEDDADALTAGESNALRMTHILNNLASNIMQKCGNSGGDPVTSHCHLTVRRRCRLTTELFRDTVLSNYFTRVQWRYADPELWSNACKILFPPKGHVLISSAQSFYLCAWYTEWKNIVSDIEDEADLRTLMDAIRRELDTYSWLPDVETNRIWRYSPHERYTHLGPRHAVSMAPRILIRTKADRPSWGPLPANLNTIIADEEDPSEEDPLAGHQNIIASAGVAPPNLELYRRDPEESEEGTSEAEQGWHSPPRIARRIPPPRTVSVPSTRGRRTAASPFPPHNQREEDEEGSEEEDAEEGAEDDRRGEPTPRDPHAPLHVSARARLTAISASTAEETPGVGRGGDLLDAPYRFDNDTDYDWDMTTAENDGASFASTSHVRERSPSPREEIPSDYYTMQHLMDSDEDEKDDIEMLDDFEMLDEMGDRTLQTPEYYS